MKFIIKQEIATTIIEAGTPKEAVRKIYPTAKLTYSFRGPIIVQVFDKKGYTFISVEPCIEKKEYYSQQNENRVFKLFSEYPEKYIGELLDCTKKEIKKILKDRLENIFQQYFKDTNMHIPLRKFAIYFNRDDKSYFRKIKLWETPELFNECPNEIREELIELLSTMNQLVMSN